MTVGGRKFISYILLLSGVGIGWALKDGMIATWIHEMGHGLGIPIGMRLRGDFWEAWGSSSVFHFSAGLGVGAFFVYATMYWRVYFLRGFLLTVGIYNLVTGSGMQGIDGDMSFPEFWPQVILCIATILFRFIPWMYRSQRGLPRPRSWVKVVFDKLTLRKGPNGKMERTIITWN